MPFIHITGAAATGKSTLARELQARGYAAYDEDTPGVGSAHEKVTNNPVVIPPADERTPEWFTRHEWKVLNGVMESLKNRAKTETVILVGNSVDPEDAEKLFDSVLYLQIDEATLRQRIVERTDNDYGKSDAEMKDILRRRDKMEKEYSGLRGVQKVNATRAPQELAEEIVRTL